MNDFQRLASEFESAFETRKRDSGDEFRCLKEGSPEWMKGLCLALHDSGDMFPNDWRYRFISDAALALVECGASRADEVYEGDSYLPDYIYYHEGYNWLASHGSRSDYADEFAAMGDANSIDDCILGGMVLESREVFEQLAREIEELVNDDG